MKKLGKTKKNWRKHAFSLFFIFFVSLVFFVKKGPLKKAFWNLEYPANSCKNKVEETYRMMTFLMMFLLFLASDARISGCSTSKLDSMQHTTAGAGLLGLELKVQVCFFPSFFPFFWEAFLNKENQWKTYEKQYKNIKSMFFLSSPTKRNVLVEPFVFLTMGLLWPGTIHFL